MTRDILQKADDGTLTITLNRPEKLNAFRNQTLKEMADALRHAERDPSVRVVVVTGAGGRAFSVGGDIGEMEKLNRKTAPQFLKNLGRLAEAFLKSPKPVVAKVDGYCLGGGNEIQLFCDLTIASDRSVFGQTGPKVGSAPLWGGTQILPLLVGLKKAKEMCLQCKTCTAREAVEMGLINRAVPVSDLEAAVSGICTDLMSKSPASMAALKKAFHADLLRQIRRDLKELEKLFLHSDFTEGMRAFMEGRKPAFATAAKFTKSAD